MVEGLISRVEDAPKDGDGVLDSIKSELYELREAHSDDGGNLAIDRSHGVAHGSRDSPTRGGRLEGRRHHRRG